MSLLENQHQNSSTIRTLSFKVENELYLIPVEDITEIINSQPITPVPRLPNYIKGVMNLRGKIVPVMDVRLKFKIKEAPLHENSCFLVISHENTHVGLIVDEVCEVLDIVEDEIQMYKASKHCEYIYGIVSTQDKTLIVLDSKALLSKNNSPEEIT
jgi:purine-binding chemotaxis protein CheW